MKKVFVLMLLTLALLGLGGVKSDAPRRGVWRTGVIGVTTSDGIAARRPVISGGTSGVSSDVASSNRFASRMAMNGSKLTPTPMSVASRSASISTLSRWPFFASNAK